MKIQLSSILVDDQKKALKFYTEILGFVKKVEIPMGEYSWLTVVSPDGSDEIELTLEPNANPAASVYQKALFKQGIPLTAFASDDIKKECEQLKALGVRFHSEPTDAGGVMIAVFDDTCGNLIQIYQN
ncbi:MAG: VOC family protein [Gemmatimonadota bacterium]|nr:VOC family protein [Gemmatimonadota bacterium]